MPINKNTTPSPVIGKAGRYTVFITPPATPQACETSNTHSHKNVDLSPPPPVQTPPQQLDHQSSARSPSNSFGFGFFWNAIASVQNGKFTFILGFLSGTCTTRVYDTIKFHCAAHSSLDRYVADWFGLNQSKYQWALDDYYDSKGMVSSSLVFVLVFWVIAVLSSLYLSEFHSSRPGHWRKWMIHYLSGPRLYAGRLLIIV